MDNPDDVATHAAHPRAAQALADPQQMLDTLSERDPDEQIEQLEDLHRELSRRLNRAQGQREK
ncbi:MAG: hypothetical protein PUK40_00400 [Actinomycetaceae bacterium]|nr:hypothetical protein [Arcanobacterium sp.]MDD7504400.1 hypothetical protein [Actinomycetaceae bacterium]MDY6143588.1 hypothetical protein [Arcanobacterium sp.]